MPSAQVINLNPTKETEPTSLEKTLTAFSKRNRENQLEKRETDELKDIYGEYQRDGQNLEKAIMSIQSRQGISPSTRVSSVKQLLEFQEHNGKLQKQAKEAAEKAEKKSQQDVIAKDLEQKLNLSPEQAQAYAANPSLLKTAFPKEPKVNQADRPIDPDQQKRIDGVLDSPHWDKASLSQKQQMLSRAGVSKSNQEATLDPIGKEMEIDNLRTKKITEGQAVSDLAFVEDQALKYPALLAREQTVQEADILNEKGVTGSNWDLAMQKAGLLQFTSDGYRIFASHAKEMVKNANIKSVIGSQISQMEFGFFRDATISERFSKEANRQIIKKEKLALRYDKLYADITRKMIEENGGEIPVGIQRKVNEEFGRQAEKISKEVRECAIDFNAIQNVPSGKVLMYDKKRRPIHVPANEVEKYSKPPFGASLS